VTASARPIAVFTTGSTLRHVIVMTATGSVGLVAIFIVDAMNLLYISMLGVEELTAAMGFATALLFFTVSVAIGMTIASGALVARALGRGSREDAAALGGASIVFATLVTGGLSLAIMPFNGMLLSLLGASGEALAQGTRFLNFVVPSTAIMSIGMAASGILRGTGDARRAMYVTLGGGIVAAILDPLLIIWLDLGLDGAAISTVFSRVALLVIGLYGARYVHGLVRLPDLTRLKAAARPFFGIAAPAVLTQLATPVGGAWVTLEMAQFGDDAVSGWAIVGRIIGVAFGMVFALFSAVGPIVGQNYGAGRADRIRSTVRDSLLVPIAYVLAIWAALALLADPIASLFGAKGEAREVILFFCVFGAGSFLFNGALFVSSAAFNNLGHPTLSTLFNWGRSTLGIVPFVWIGARYNGAEGVVAGWSLGAVVFGIASVVVCFRIIRLIGERPPPGGAHVPDLPPAANAPVANGKASTLG
jgi:putative MATE family efflux protein